MSVTLTTNWRDEPCEAATSRGGVLGLKNIKDNVMCGNGEIWPPAALVQKYYQSNQVHSFDPEERAVLSESLGYYCDLQSIHSEDAITWSFFGTLLAEPSATRAAVLNWICGQLNLPNDNANCDISLFQRIPHPDTLVSGGPEIDAILHGERSVVYIEAKWLSGEGKKQGVSGNSTQLQLRHEFFKKYGYIYGEDRTLAVVALTLKDRGIDQNSDEAEALITHCLTWEQLCECQPHPLIEELAKYFKWKQSHSRL